MKKLQRALEREEGLSYALLFGSRARETAHAGSDLDLAVGIATGPRLGSRQLGDLVSRLEKAAGCAIDLVLLDEAPPAVASSQRDDLLAFCEELARRAGDEDEGR